MMSPESPEGGSNRVNMLITLLAEVKVRAEERDRTSIEIAETLWLAMQMEPAAAVEPEEEPQPPTRTTSIIDLGDDIPNDSPEFLLPEVKPKVKIAAPTPQVGVLPPEVLPIWVGDPAMLTDSLAMIRALKPLLRKVDAGVGSRLNESATVDYIARTQLCLPILEPDQESWFDIVLIVDRGSSMHIWQRLVKDVVRILRRYGAFRNVQVFDLAVDTAKSELSDLKDAVHLVSNPQRPGHRPSELIDQQGRRLMIVLSDCAGSYWWDGTLLPMLKDWGMIMPTVIWQMLPPWMWKRTALGRGVSVEIRNDIPGAANQRLQSEIQDRQEPDAADRRISVPIMTGELGDLERWSGMVAGDRQCIAPGFLLPQRGGSVPRTRTIEEIAGDRAQQLLDQGQDLTPEKAYSQALDQIARERVQRFLDLSSPQAQRLVMLLAAAPVITLPVVRLIRDAMLYDAQSPLPIAEVFLSGLVQRLPGQDEAALEQAIQDSTDAREEGQEGAPALEIEADLASLEARDLVQYDFVPRVRSVLLEKLPGVDTIEVVNSVSAAVERRWNQVSDQDFRAFLMNPNAEAPEGLAGLRSFASITADILEPLGRQYASFVQELRHGSGQEPPPVPSMEEDDFPLIDIEYEVAQFINFPPLQPCEYQSATITAILDRFDFETATIAKENRWLGLRQDWVIKRRRAIAWGYTELLSTETGEEIGLDMIAIPAGQFTMGAPEREPESRENERPQHEVTLESFYMGRYPVTQAQWRVVAGYEQIDRELDPDPFSFKGDNRPVENVSWEDAQEFCKRLSAKTGKNYRLPSEAQWEYACRAGTTTPFHFGEIITTELVNYDGNYTYNGSPKGEYREETTEVGSFPGNTWGLHDMHGNVWEWCEDDWHSSYKDAPNDGSAWVETDQTDSSKLLRGGSWGFVPDYCRSAIRVGNARDSRSYFFGFRVCCVPPRILP